VIVVQHGFRAVRVPLPVITDGSDEVNREDACGHKKAQVDDEIYLG
jgi:hypothetical protein